MSDKKSLTFHSIRFGVMQMNSLFKQIACGVSLALVVSACGGSSGAAGGGRTAQPGSGVTTASGAEVTKAAEESWNKAMANFNQAEQAGWTEDSCSSVSSDFERANSKQGGGFTEAVFMAGLSLEKCGKMDAALEFYNRALQLNPKFCKARVGLGLDQLAKGDKQQAYVTFQRAVQDDARCTEGYTNLAMLQMERGGAEADEALNNLRRALAIDAQFLPAFNQMALLFLERAQKNRKMLDLAAVVCRQAQLIDENYAPIYNTWGLINVRKKNVFDALRMFEKAFKLDSEIYEAHMNFGQITLNFRGYEDAKTAFTKATTLDPKSYDAHIGLGAALRGLGDTAGAEVEYKKAIELDSSRPEAYFNLGLLYQDYMSGSVEDMKQALSYYDQFVQRARGKAQFQEAVEDVERECAQRQSRRKRSSKACRPGRRQNIETAIEALEAMAEMQAEQEAMEQQQQQQQEQEQPAEGGEGGE